MSKFQIGDIAEVLSHPDDYIVIVDIRDDEYKYHFHTPISHHCPPYLNITKQDVLDRQCRLLTSIFRGAM